MRSHFGLEVKNELTAPIKNTGVELKNPKVSLVLQGAVEINPGEQDDLSLKLFLK